MTATATTLRTGMIVIYHGSKTAEHGCLFRISSAETLHGTQRLDLISYSDTSPHARPTLTGARPESVTRIPASDIRDRKCRDCGTTYTSSPAHDINADGCPLCALPEPVFA